MVPLGLVSSSLFCFTVPTTPTIVNASSFLNTGPSLRRRPRGLVPGLAVGTTTTGVARRRAEFPSPAFDTGGGRSALLHRQFDECAPGHVRRPGLDCLPFWLQP